MERKVTLVRFSVRIWDESHPFGIVTCKHKAGTSLSQAFLLSLSLSLVCAPGHITESLPGRLGA